MKKAKGKSFLSVRDLVEFLQKEEISREDIVAVFPLEGLVFLIWYK